MFMSIIKAVLNIMGTAFISWIENYIQRRANKKAAKQLADTPQDRKELENALDKDNI